jgi:aminopeptidase N
LWLAYDQGQATFDLNVGETYRMMAAPGGGVSFGPPGDPSPRDLFSGGVYYRGAMTLHALRVEVGDEDFFEILRAYADRYQHSNASTADFIAVAEEISGQALDDFFNGWLYDEEVPELDF